MDYKFLLDIGLIILVVKLLELVTQRIHVPRILGSLLAGVLLGPAVLNIVQSSSPIEFLSKIGIIFIMFLAGMETSLKRFLSSTKNFVVIAVLGVIFPLVLGFLCSFAYKIDFELNLFFGAVITATSVSITIQSLIDMKKIKTNVGTAILGAGVVDDIIGIIFLTILLNSSDLSLASLFIVALKIIIFFLIAIFIAFIMHNIFQWFESKSKPNEKLPIFSIAVALIFSYFAESFGVSGVIGAYIAGLAIGNTKQANYIKSHVDTLVHMFFAPIFFASIGLKLQTLSLPFNVWLFVILFVVVAIASKLIGNGIGAKLCGYSKAEAIQIGLGMATRGEVALIMVEEALRLGIIGYEAFSVVVISILLITIISPILFNLSFKPRLLNLLRKMHISVRLRFDSFIPKVYNIVIL